jgi:Sec-independent protein translocase protein TatA
MSLGVPELVVVGAIVFLLFGGRALKGLGAGIGEFVKSIREVGK